jgi:hypothetical protein
MSKPVERWLLFKYVGLEFTPLSKPFKTKKEAEKAREKYPRASAQKDRARGDSDQEVGKAIYQTGRRPVVANGRQ